MKLQQHHRGAAPLLLGAAFLSQALGLSCRAENWPHWRGPSFNGATTGTNLPAEFTKTNNVKWVADMPGPSAATPIVWDDRVFVSSTDQRTKTLVAIALDRQTGKQLWQEEVGVGLNLDERSNFASPSPVTDGKIVVYFYGNGDLGAFDLAGRKLWARNLKKDYGDFAFNWTFSSGPTLSDGKLFLQVLQRDVPVRGRGSGDGPIDSYLLALDPLTGKELWRHIRPTDARMESREAYSTPIPFLDQGRLEILVAGADCLTAHDPKSGEELWRWATWNPTRIGNYRLVPSPVAARDVVLVCAPQQAPIYAIRSGGKGMLGESALLWKSTERELSSDTATPLFYEGKFYVLNGDRQTLARVDPVTGKTDWIGELGGSRVTLQSSPTGADGKIYFQNFRGEVFVVAAGDSFKLLARIPMGEEGDNMTRSSIAVSQGNLFIRTNGKLYCVGN